MRTLNTVSMGMDIDKSVAVVGYGLSRFNRLDMRSYSVYEHAAYAYADMLNNSASIKDLIKENGIDAIITSTSDPNPYSASIIAEMLNIRPKIANRVESMCSSGANAIITAYSYIVSKLCKSVLVVGFDTKDSIGMRLDWDDARGVFKHPAHWAAIYARAYMREFNLAREHLAMVAVKNRKNALSNRYAYFYNSSMLTIEQVLNSKPVVEPLRLYDCSIPCNGASVALLTDYSTAKRISNYGRDEEHVWIKGIGSSSIGAGINSIKDLRCMYATVTAARDAYAMSNVKPSMIDVAQVHDAFTICEIMAYEDLGFVSKGEGVYALEGKVSIPDVNTDGGILGRGHSAGATGVAQLALLTDAIKRNDDYRIGLMHNMAAAGTSASVIILERE